MELVTLTQQTIQPNEDVLFGAASVPGSSSIIWRQGSGIVTLRGLFNNQCRARFKVNYGGDIAVPTGETAGPISLAIAINGEAIPASRATSTPIDVENFNNVFRELYIDTPIGCCTQVTVKNVGTTPILLDAGASIIVERVA